MLRNVWWSVAKVAAAAITLSVWTVGAPAEEALRTIDTPGVGHIVFGPIEGEKSLSGGLGTILRSVHGRFGDRPQIGRLFRARNSDSVAAFFTMTPKTNAPGPIAGMVIVCKPAGQDAAAALLYDDANRFQKSVPALLKILGDAWHPANAGPSSDTAPAAGRSNVHAGRAAPLNTFVFSDRSGSIGLPDGWHVMLAVRGGVRADGPNGEKVDLGRIVRNIVDLTDPRARQSLRFLNPNGGPFLNAPYNRDLVENWRSIAQQSHQLGGTPVPTITVLKQTVLPPGFTGSRVVNIQAEIDNNDGKGPQIADVRLGTIRPGATGAWSLCVDAISVPKPLAAAESETVKAIVSSWRQDGAVIQRQTDKEIDKIHQIGKDVTERIDRTHKAEDEHNAAIRQQWDNQDKYSKGFQNYQFDRAVVQDNELGGHATTSSSLAALLVEANPNRYQYVNTQDYLRGIDY